MPLIFQDDRRRTIKIREEITFTSFSSYHLLVLTARVKSEKQAWLDSYKVAELVFFGKEADPTRMHRIYSGDFRTSGWEWTDDNKIKITYNCGTGCRATRVIGTDETLQISDRENTTILVRKIFLHSQPFVDEFEGFTGLLEAAADDKNQPSFYL